MGAVLVTHILVGPRKIEFTDEAVGIASETRKELLQEAEGWVEENGLGGCASEEEAIQEFLVDRSVPRELPNVNVEEAVREFVNTWNRNKRWRNFNFRVDPNDQNRVIVVAGERTPGDTPQGAYRVFQTADALGLFSHYGIN
jgi:hypothetical protein